MRLILKISATNFACYIITYYLLQKITEINYTFLAYKWATFPFLFQMANFKYLSNFTQIKL